MIGVGSYLYLMGGAMLPYPSTVNNSPVDLRGQYAMESLQGNPNVGKVIPISMSDRRMPWWLGWQKYAYADPITGLEMHYVGNRLFPSWYPWKPWLDFKFKS